MNIAMPLESDLWFRISGRRLELRNEASVVASIFRGRRWFLLRDPDRGEYLRIHEVAWRFVQLLDGSRTVDEAWRSANRKAGELAMSQPEVVELIGLLFEHNLLRSDGAVSAAGLSDRVDRRRIEVGSRRWASLLAFKIPLLRPDAALSACLPILRHAFSKPGLFLWMTLLAIGLSHVVGRQGALEAAARAQFRADPLHLVSIGAIFIAIKFVHEWSHGIACRHFAQRAGLDGSVREMGVLLIALLPVPYVDATNSWSLPSKWQRAAVALAGIYAEIALAAIAAIVWGQTGAGFLNTAAAQVMLVAGISTIVFNANPLLRFDGYYATSDLLEIPNLAGRSSEYLIYRLKCLLGVEDLVDPSHVSSERPWLIGYAVAAGGYRLAVVFWLLLMVAERAFLVGLALALYGAFLWGVVPLFKLIRYLMGSRELASGNGRARRRALCVGALLLAIGFLVPLPRHLKLQGVLEPVKFSEIHLEDDGQLDQVLPSGTTVSPGGAPIAQLENRSLRARLAQVGADRDRTRIHWRESHGRDPVQSQLLTEDLAVLDRQYDRLVERINSLWPIAPFEGTWIAPDLSVFEGSVLRSDRGQALGIVADFREMRIRAVANQQDGPEIADAIEAGAEVEFRLASRPGESRAARVERISPSALKIPHASLGLSAGGLIRTTKADSLDTVEPVFEIRVIPVASDEGLPHRIHERATVRVALAWEPLVSRGWRSLRQLLQQRLAV